MSDFFDTLFTKNSLNTLLFYDPYAKLCFSSTLTTFFKKTIYIDFDTTFTAYANAGFILNYSPKSVLIFTPDEGEMEFLLQKIILNLANTSLIIIDSINSFYNLYYKKIDPNYFKGIASVQHILSNFLMLLLKHCKSLNIPILVTSMMRYKNKEIWVRMPSNRRFIQKKSGVIFSVEMLDESNLWVSISLHPFLGSKKVVMKTHGISF
ncbi:MAG: hypothetical protein ACE5SW_04485 [Nitrososphaeraceae archaeon]